MTPVAIEVPHGHTIQVQRPQVTKGDIVVFHEPGISLVRLLPQDEAERFAGALRAHGLMPCVTCRSRQCDACPVARFASAAHGQSLRQRLRVS